MNLFRIRLVLFHLCFASFTLGILLQQISHFLFFLVSLTGVCVNGFVPGTLFGRGKRAAALLMAAIFLAAVASQWQFRGWVDFEFHWAFLAFWLVTPSLIERTNWVAIHRLILLFSLPGLIYSYYWMMRPEEIAWAIEKGFHMFPRAQGFVSNPITNAATLIIIACWSFSRLTAVVPRVERGLIWLHLFFSIFIVVISRVRIGIIGFLFVFLAVALLSEKLRKRALWMTFLVLVLFLGTWSFFGFNMGSIEERVQLLENSWILIKEFPFLGIGPDHFSSFIIKGGNLAAHPHNTLVGITAETGLLGLAAYLGFILVAGMAIWRLMKAPGVGLGQNDWLPKSLLLVYLSYWVVGLADYNFADTELLLAHSFHFAAGVILALKLAKPRDPNGRGSFASIPEETLGSAHQ